MLIFKALKIEKLEDRFNELNEKYFSIAILNNNEIIEEFLIDYKEFCSCRVLKQSTILSKYRSILNI